MTKKEKVAVWRSRIKFAQEKRKAFFEGVGVEGTPGWVPGADFAIASYRGNAKPKWWNDADPYVNINKVKSAIRASLPSLLYSNPEYKVFPAAVDMEQGVDVAYERSKAKALWLNHVYREASGNTHVRVAIQNAYLSMGVVKCGYRCQYEDDSQRGVFAMTDDGQYILDESGDPTLERGEFLTDEDGELIRDGYGIPVLHPGTITKEEWDISAVDPKMMLFDVEGGADFFQHRYVIEEWVRPLEQVKDDPRFPAALRKRLTQTETARGQQTQRKSIFSTNDDPSTGDDKLAVDKDEARLRGYDIYDFASGEYLVLPECGLEGENEELLLDAPMPAGMEHGPYRFLKFTEDAGTEWYPIPDGIDMATVNREYNITRSQMMIHREHTKTRYLVKEDTFAGAGIDQEEEKAKLTNGPDATCITVSDLGGIIAMPKAQLDSSFGQAIPNIAMDFNEVSGSPGEMRGIENADSATQASIIATGAETRNNDRRDNQVATFLNEIGRALLISGQANAELDTLVVEKVVEAVGVAPFKAVKLTPAELLGEFEVTIAIGSTMAKNDPRVLQQLQAMLANIGQNPVLGLFKGLNRRILDGLGLDPLLADEIYDASMAFLQSQQQPAQAEGPVEQQGQQLAQMLGMTGNAAGGSPTGAPIN